MVALSLKQYLSSSLPTADWPNQSVSSTQIEDNVSMFQASSRLTQRVITAAPLLLSWMVTLHYLFESDKTELEIFWRERDGRAKPFKWVHPETRQIYFVHFADATINFERLPSAIPAWTITLSLAQAHPAEINNDEGI